MATQPIFEIRAKADVSAIIYALLAVVAGAGGALALSQLDNPVWALGVSIALMVTMATLAKPEIGLFTLVVMTYIRFSDVLIKSHGLPSTAQPLVALLIAVITIHWLFGRQPSPGWVRSAALVILYGLVGLVSLLSAHDFTSAQLVISDYAKDAVIAIVVTILLQRAATLRQVIWSLLATGIFMGTISVFQQLTHEFENDFWGFGQAPLQNIVGQVSDNRVSGPIGDPNFYAQILVVLVPLALDRLWHERSIWPRLIAGWAFVVCSLTVVFTFSRGGFIGLIVVIAAMFLLRPPRPVVWLVTLALAIPLLNLVPDNYMERIQTIPQSLPFMGGDVRNEISLRGRASEGTVAWMMFLDHPILGVGLGNYPVMYQEYSRKLGIDPRTEQRQAHDLYLEVLSETGLVGLGVFGLLIWSMFYSLAKARKVLLSIPDSPYPPMFLAYGVGLLGYLSAALFLHLAYPRFFWLLFGIALAAPQIASHELQIQKRRLAEATRND